jgi:threonine/homoserine/homoserine lactone efflux protein
MLTDLLSMPELGFFLAAALVLAFTPGPGILYVMARTVSGGTAEGIASTLGTAVGGLVHVVVAAVGLSALLAASAKGFLIVKFVGAAYLIFLGLRSVARARRMPAIPTTAPHGSQQAFLEGILTEALNVKTALFFLAFIPQFINHALPAAPQFALLGLVCVILNTGVDCLAVLLAARLSGYFRHSPKPAQYMALGSGSVLIGLGAYVALAHPRH